jgi:hypothetical protein
MATENMNSVIQLRYKYQSFIVIADLVLCCRRVAKRRGS